MVYYIQNVKNLLHVTTLTQGGLKAMKEFAALERERNGNENVTKASDEMCTFLVINISSFSPLIIPKLNPISIINPQSLLSIKNLQYKIKSF